MKKKKKMPKGPHVMPNGKMMGDKPKKSKKTMC